MANWIAKATSKNKGKFKAKAQAAGMSTKAYAEREKGAGGTLGKEAGLALTLMKIHGGGHASGKREYKKGGLVC